jgi:hypothetical protein
MALEITEIHPAAGADLLNSEWFVLHNTGDKPFNTRNCSLVVHLKGGSKRTALGTLDPGFNVGPGERVRIVTGNPGRKAHGAMPDGEPRCYSLFLAGPVLRGSGTILELTLRSRTLAAAEFAPDATGGVRVNPA